MKLRLFCIPRFSKGLSFKITLGNILTPTPPLIITKQEMEQAFKILDEASGS